MTSTLSYEDQLVVKEKINVFLAKVIEQSNTQLNGCVENYQIALPLPDDGQPLRRQNDVIMFWTLSLGDTDPEGRISRSVNWVGFGKFGDKVLAELNDDLQRICLEMLGEKELRYQPSLDI